MHPAQLHHHWERIATLVEMVLLFSVVAVVLLDTMLFLSLLR